MKKLINYKNEKLKQASLEILDSEDIGVLLADMDKMATFFQAYGISAVQLGELKRVFLFRTKVTDNFKVVINPEIIDMDVSTTSTAIEGCLSFPNISLPIVRPSSVTVKYTSINKDEIIETLYGMEARVWLHEYDHLEGYTIIDDLSVLKRNIVKKKIEKWQRKMPLSGMVYENK